MNSGIKQFFFNSSFYDLYRTLGQRWHLLIWRHQGRPMPPPELLKQEIVKQYASRFSLPIFIESGTYLGDMTDAVKNLFQKIYSIELNPVLYKRAKKRFAKFDQIVILQGDSGKILPEILCQINQPSLFWLDAHFSYGITGKGRKITPIKEELGWILSHPIENHVILIDDANSFSGADDYPTLEEIRQLFLNKRPNLKFEVKGNIICVFPWKNEFQKSF